jgi:hypothetical protein
MPKIKIDKELYEGVKKVSENAGYSSTEEFVTHLLEKVVNPPDAEDNDQDLVNRLQGLGYIS